MKCKGQVLWLVTAAILCGGLSGPARSDGRRGAATVRFVRLTEKRVERQERLAMVVRQLDGEETTILVLPAKGEPRDVARKLREGQVITVGYVSEGGAVWVTRLQRREGDREGEGQDRGREGDREGQGEGDRDRGKGGAEEDRDRDGDRQGRQRPEKDDREGEGRGRRRDGDRDDAGEGRGRGDREDDDEGRGDRGRGDRDEPEVRRLVRRLLERVEKLELRVRKLEEQNAALRKALRGD